MTIPRNKENFLVFGSPLIEQKEIDEVVKCMESSWLGTGPRVSKFQADFAKYKGINDAAALNSCTAALHLAILATIKPGDEVITTPMTFCATVNSILHAGGKPVLADVDANTFNINPEEVKKKISKRTKAILPVHFAGRACEMDELKIIADKFNVKIIEDCAHAIETEYKGQKAGTIGDFGCFSFYSTKNVVTGEGGMVVAKDHNDLERIRVLGLHGMSKHAWKRFGDEGFKHYQVVECGFKYNMMDLQAAIGIHQLERVERYWEKRKNVWERYMNELSSLPIKLPAPVDPQTKHAYHLFTILIDEEKTNLSRDEFLNGMTKNGIGVGVHYLSIPDHPYYQEKLGWRPEDVPVATKIGHQTVSLPISAKLSDEDMADVIMAVKNVLGC